jgi:hypothetical protein
MGARSVEERPLAAIDLGAPEAHFITLCVRDPDATEPEEIHSAAAAVSDWNALVATTIRHGVAALVRQAANRDGLTLPATIEIVLRDASFGAMTQVMALDAELRRIVEGLRAAAVPVIVLKGPVLGRTIYETLALRPFGDLDLTVQREHEAAAAETLVGLGFREMSFSAEAERQAHQAHAGHVHGEGTYHRWFVAGDQNQILIELHTDSLQLGIEPACEDARWRRALPVPNLPGALMLCPEDQLVQLSVHAHKHGFDRLIWLKDLDLLIRIYGETLNWGLVDEVTRREGVRSSVWYALRLVSSLLGTPIGRERLVKLQPSLLVRFLYGQIWPVPRIASLGGYMRRHWVQFHAAESWQGVLPSLLMMGRRRERALAAAQTLLRR